jgi:CheY-like chemotaxis protein
MGKIMREQLPRYLREALNHLRDPIYLRQSPLVTLFGVADEPDTPAALRHILVEAVKSLKPEADEPAQSPAWRLYEALFYRYVQYFSQLEVADQLGISTRQLRREQGAALEELACRLSKRFNLETNPAGDSDVARETEAASMGVSIQEDLTWLKDAPPAVPTDLDQELPAVLDLARPLAAQHKVRLEIVRSADMPRLAVPPVALRQALLCLLSVAISRAAPSAVSILTRLQGWEVEIEVRRAETVPVPQEVLDDNASSLNLARQLADLFGGKLIIADDAKAFSATLTLPVQGQVPVLAIDDNPDTLHLLQRYTAGTRYRLVGTQNPGQALSLAEELGPHIIVLDVMMPEIDGWEMLGRLRQHPLTAHIPIVVCTILTQEELALSLGASAFVRKPITRQAFLAALDRHVAPPGTESR